MDEHNVREILEIILDKVQDRKCIWRLEGSANLKMQGVDVSIRDLDITTNDAGIEFFRHALEKFISKDCFSHKINGHTLVCYINGFEVEINSYSNKELEMFERTKKILWRGLWVPILPLEHAKKFYELINRKEKVELISEHLQK